MSTHDDQHDQYAQYDQHDQQDDQAEPVPEVQARITLAAGAAVRRPQPQEK